MTLELQLQEPLADALVTLLEGSLNTEIEAINTHYSDQYVVAPVQEIVPFLPVPSTLMQGLPAVGFQELPTEFEDDTQFSLNALHKFAVIAVITNVDHPTLVMQLRRTQQAIANVIQADRLLGTAAGSGGVMRDQGGAMSVNFDGTVPGPLLGDSDPNQAEQTPSSYLSWTSLVFTARRVEVG